MKFITQVRQGLSRVGNLFRPIIKVVPYGNQINPYAAVYPDPGAKTAIEKGFNSNYAVYAIVMKDARKFGSIPRFLYDARLTEEKARQLKAKKTALFTETKAYTRFDARKINNKAKKLETLLSRPNKWISQDLFYEGLRCYYKVVGEAMIWLNRGDIEEYRNPDGSFQDDIIDKLPVLEMYVLPADQVKVIPDPDDIFGILGYEWQLSKPRYIRAGDVIHWKSTNLNFNEYTREHLRGFPGLIPGNKVLESNNSSTDAMVRGSQNDGAKFALFNETMDQMSPTQQTDLKAVIDRKINNNDVKGAVAVLQGKWGGIDLGKSSVDMQLLDGRKISMQELSFLLDTPYEFFDSQVTYANKEQAQIGWITNTIDPACKQLDGEMNRVLLKAFDLVGEAFIASDLTGLAEMKKAAIEAAKTLQEIWSIFPNEVREFLGYEATEDEIFNQPWVPTGRVPISEYMDSLAAEQAALQQARDLINT